MARHRKVSGHTHVRRRLWDYIIQNKQAEVQTAEASPDATSTGYAFHAMSTSISALPRKGSQGLKTKRTGPTMKITLVVSKDDRPGEPVTVSAQVRLKLS